MSIDDTTRIVDSTVGDTEIREFVTVHDSTIGDDCRLYERVSVKQSHVADHVDINAGSYVENAEIGPTVQIGPNSSVVGVTHDLDESGMTFRDDIFERIILEEGVFVGAGAVVGPGVTIGRNSVIAAGVTVARDVPAAQIVLGSPPSQRIVPLAQYLE